MQLFITSIAIAILVQTGLQSCGSDKMETGEQKIIEKPLAENRGNLDLITLPDGFRIDYFAKDIRGARSMTLSPSGVLYVGTRQNGNVYALRDTNRDNKADIQYVLASGLRQPNGVAYRDGDLYVAEISRILRFNDVESNLENPKEPEVLFDDYPTDGHHGWKYIAFGPDNKLYVPVGAPCNICKSEEDVFASITAFDVESKTYEIVHNGIRNTVGFDWHPSTGKLWFTDNGGDMLGDNMPGDELNYAPEAGLHFGYPYCHQGNYPDPKLGEKGDCEKYRPPAQILGPHVAALGMEFYEGDQFPAQYHNQIFIAEHGSWNRSVPLGYRITLVRLEGDRTVSYDIFAEGWLQDTGPWGRPVDVEIMPDGSLLVSDDKGDSIYRISYQGS